MYYIGFDLGDGESSVAVLEHDSDIEPKLQEINGVFSILSAVGTQKGEILIGEAACITEGVADLQVRFKSRFLTSSSSCDAIRLFARGVAQALQAKGVIKNDRQTVTIIGCPAGWNATTREKYRRLFEEAGFPCVTIVSESRAAFLHAKHARDVKVDYELLNKSALVIDIGSSTTDFAYIENGHEINVGTFGDIYLGGGLIDSYILQAAVKASLQRQQIEAVFSESRSWYSYCEIAARRLKEKYFSDEQYWSNHTCEKTVNIYYDGMQSLKIFITPELIWRIINEPLQELGGRSFCACLQEALNHSATVTQSNPPRLVLLTGGASRMAFFREQCRNTFPDAVIVCCPEPEYSIARGLAYSGRVDTNLRAFREAVHAFVKSGEIEKVVKEDLPVLIPQVSEVLTDLLMEKAMMDILTQWYNGSIRKLNELDQRLKDRISIILKDKATYEALVPVLVKWTSSLCAKLQPYINELCDQFGIPREEMILERIQAEPDQMNMEFTITQIFGLDVVGNIVSIITGLISGMICGGTGTAIIAAGFVGIAVGILIGVIAAAVGWKKAKKLIMDADIANPIRKLLPKSALEKRLKAQKKRLNDSLLDAMNSNNGSFTRELNESISKELAYHLEQMAKAAEIPIE